MATLFVRHQVEDFETWKQAYDAFRPTQERLGVTAQSVYRTVGDGNDVTVFHDFATVEAAQAFLGNAEVQSVMASAGVVGEPSIWVVDPA